MAGSQRGSRVRGVTDGFDLSLVILSEPEGWTAGFLLPLHFVFLWNMSPFLTLAFTTFLSGVSIQREATKPKGQTGLPPYSTPSPKTCFETHSSSPDLMTATFSPQSCPEPTSLHPSSLFHSRLVECRILGTKLFSGAPGVYSLQSPGVRCCCCSEVCYWSNCRFFVVSSHFFLEPLR